MQLNLSYPHMWKPEVATKLSHADVVLENESRVALVFVDDRDNGVALCKKRVHCARQNVSDEERARHGVALYPRSDEDDAAAIGCLG
jgi:hypothetical protein